MVKEAFRFGELQEQIRDSNHLCLSRSSSLSTGSSLQYNSESPGGNLLETPNSNLDCGIGSPESPMPEDGTLDWQFQESGDKESQVTSGGFSFMVSSILKIWMHLEHWQKQGNESERMGLTHEENDKPRAKRGRKPSRLSYEEKRKMRLERGRLAGE